MKALAAMAVALAFMLTPAIAQARHLASTSDAKAARVIGSRHHINGLRSRTWHYQDLRKARRSETRYLERNVHALPRLHRLALYWYHRLVAARRAYLRYYREQSAGTGLAHYALWHCITNGAYPGAPHEGNGYNGKYTGPLGMSTPWMGHMPPGSDWVHSDVGAVYAIAEQEAAKQGFADWWMRGQWPATYPPCSNLA